MLITGSVREATCSCHHSIASLVADLVMSVSRFRVKLTRFNHMPLPLPRARWRGVHTFLVCTVYKYPSFSLASPALGY